MAVAGDKWRQMAAEWLKMAVMYLYSMDQSLIPPKAFFHG